ncbi:hypothetical protein V6N13_036245 [Hibiscus sabdariffa]|uniref:Uncharacterized protein n=1 Tax=Hibiscus sabdariffa TaxID=183260 RepID=A0ABR2S7C9_9ROSI
MSFEELVSTGEIIGKIESPIDKVEAFNNILQGCSDDEKRKLTVFIVSFVPLFAGLVEKQKEYAEAEGSDFVWKGESGILYTVESWDEIHALVLGCY